MDSSDHPQAGPQDEPDKKPPARDAKARRPAKPVDTSAQEEAGQDRADGGGYS